VAKNLKEKRHTVGQVDMGSIGNPQ